MSTGPMNFADFGKVGSGDSNDNLWDEFILSFSDDQKENPLLKFIDEKTALWDQLILSFGGEQKENEDEPLSMAEKPRRKISSMNKIRQGFTVASRAADHVMPAGWLKMIAVLESIREIRRCALCSGRWHPDSERWAAADQIHDQQWHVDRDHVSAGRDRQPLGRPLQAQRVRLPGGL